jgi:hypothetical protein
VNYTHFCTNDSLYLIATTFDYPFLPTTTLIGFLQYLVIYVQLAIILGKGRNWLFVIFGYLIVCLSLESMFTKFN